MHAGDPGSAKLSLFISGTMIWTSKSRQWDNCHQLWLCKFMLFFFRFRRQVFEYFFSHYERVNGVFLCVSHLRTAGSRLSPQAEVLYITHYEIRMCTSLWNCTILRFCLPVRKQAARVLYFTPLPNSHKIGPARASTHPSKSPVSGHWPAEGPSPSTPCSSPWEPKQPSRWQGACGVNAHTNKNIVHLFKHTRV